RLILNKKGDLKVINSPVIPPADLPRHLSDFHNSPLAKYEFWYNPDNYSSPSWLKSRFIQILYNKFRQPRPDYKTYEEMEKAGGVPESVSLAILRQFAREVEETGAIPIILHIPKKSHLKLVRKGETPAYYSLFSDLEKNKIMVVDPAQEMKDKHHLYLRSHLSPEGGQIVSRILAEAILRILSEKNLLDFYNGEPPNYYSRKSAGELFSQFNNKDEVMVDIGTPRDRDFIVSGVHFREKHLNKTPVRWTTGTAILRLPIFPKKGKTPFLNIKILDTGPERKSFDGAITVTINGNEVACTRLDQGEHSYQIKLSPGAVREPELALITITSQPWQPDQIIESKDTRMLGVMLDRIRLKYEYKLAPFGR
ncbi:MAG: hypothetical protein U9N73_11565, partial [Candidatus Auribacterota bacterium]|nr:hypothetical protein [Candidatus Auribacterota bacterium]